MSVPCSARCVNQSKNCCQLNDERISASRAEFGEEWNPVEQCVGYLPREKLKKSKKDKS